MKVCLIQHGEAKSEEEDPARQLTETGIQDVKKIAAFLGPLQVQAIWHSGKARAKQTAEILATKIKAQVVQKEGLSPNDSVGPIKQSIEEAGQDIMLVGHLPFLSRLTNLMLGDETKELVKFQNAGVVCLELSGGWKVAWMVVPGLF
jgi:phosphohistidine phosphatase